MLLLLFFSNYICVFIFMFINIKIKNDLFNIYEDHINKNNDLYLFIYNCNLLLMQIIVL